MPSHGYPDLEREAVDRLTAEMRNAGVTVTGGPGIAGDGHYEASVVDTAGNPVEITAESQGRALPENAERCRGQTTVKPCSVLALA